MERESILAEVNPEEATASFSVASKDKELLSSSDGDNDRESVDYCQGDFEGIAQWCLGNLTEENHRFLTGLCDQQQLGVEGNLHVGDWRQRDPVDLCRKDLLYGY